MAASELCFESTHLRTANEGDIPMVRQLIRGLAEFENRLDECPVPEEKLQGFLFGLPPLKGPTVVLLEVSSSKGPDLEEAAAPEQTQETLPLSRGQLAHLSLHEKPPELKEEHEPLPNASAVKDPDAANYASAFDSSRTLVGFALFYPCYSSYAASTGLHVEDLFVRSPYRGLGFGTKLLSHVSKIALQIGVEKVEWTVLDWNQKAIDFYRKKMKATLLHDWRICKLTGDALIEAANGVPLYNGPAT